MISGLGAAKEPARPFRDSRFRNEVIAWREGAASQYGQMELGVA